LVPFDRWFGEGGKEFVTMKKLFLSAVVLGSAVGAQGAFYENSAVFPLGLTDFTTSVTLDKFDPNLGDLISVSYTLEASVLGEVSVDNESANPASVTLIVAGQVKLRDGLATWLEVSSSTTEAATLGPDSDDAPDFTGSDSQKLLATLTATDSETTTDLPTLNWFTATVLGETFSWDVDASGSSGVMGSGIRATIPPHQASGKVTVRYEYASQVRFDAVAQVIPEASTCVAGLGLIGVTAVAGKRMLKR